MNLTFRSRAVQPSDADVWESMRRELWPEGAPDHAAEIEQFFAGSLSEPQEVLFLESAEGTVLGMVELSLRGDLPGFAKERLAYIEGLFVRTTFRGSSVARQLIAAARDWAYVQHSKALATDRQERLIYRRLLARRGSHSERMPHADGYIAMGMKPVVTAV